MTLIPFVEGGDSANFTTDGKVTMRFKFEGDADDDDQAKTIYLHSK